MYPYLNSNFAPAFFNPINPIISHSCFWCIRRTFFLVGPAIERGELQLFKAPYSINLSSQIYNLIISHTSNTLFHLSQRRQTCIYYLNYSAMNCVPKLNSSFRGSLFVLQTLRRMYMFHHTTPKAMNEMNHSQFFAKSRDLTVLSLKHS